MSSRRMSLRRLLLYAIIAFVGIVFLKIRFSLPWDLAAGFAVVIVAAAIIYHYFLHDIVEPVTDPLNTAQAARRAHHERTPHWRDRWRQGLCPACGYDLRETDVAHAGDYACPDCEWSGSRPAKLAPLNPDLLKPTTDAPEVPPEPRRRGLPPGSMDQWG